MKLQRYVSMPEKKVLSRFKDVCNINSNNINFIMDNVKRNPQLESIFRNSLRIVRYEDIIRDAYTVSKKLYNFLQLVMPKEVEVFSQSYAGVHVWNVPNMTSKTSPFKQGQELQSWQTKLPFQKVALIQTTCKHSMQILGYKMISNEGDLTDVKTVTIGMVDKNLPFYAGL